MKRSIILMLLGSVLLLSLFFVPLWNIELGAPQYPNHLGMNIYINGIKGVNEFDLQNINGLNHYIGMKPIPKDNEMWEFTAFPIIIAFMSILGILIAIGIHLNKFKSKALQYWLVIMATLGVLGMYDFNKWLTYYGNTLSSNAIIKIEDKTGVPLSYKPPLFGYKKLLNFDVYSYPHLGAYIIIMGYLLMVIAYKVNTMNKYYNQ